jgi:transcriptional regulator with XRE-family HTH domain
MTLAQSAFKDIFRENLQFLRKSQNLTQNELSLRCDFSRSYVGKIERGDVDPSLESIQRIAEALDVSPVLLFIPLPEPSSESSGFEQTRDEIEFSSQSTAPETPEGFVKFLSNRIVDYYQHFEAFFEEAPFGDVLISVEGEILHANKTFQEFVNAKLMNHSLKKLASYVHPSDRDALETFLDNIIAGNENEGAVLRFLRDSEDPFIGYVILHQVKSSEASFFPDCEKNTETPFCSGKDCIRLLVLDVSQLPSNKKIITNFIN